MSGFAFSASCIHCGSELRELTASSGSGWETSARVVCSGCGTQWAIDCVLRPWPGCTEDDYRESAIEAAEAPWEALR